MYFTIIVIYVNSPYRKSFDNNINNYVHIIYLLGNNHNYNNI